MKALDRDLLERLARLSPSDRDNLLSFLGAYDAETPRRRRALKEFAAARRPKKIVTDRHMMA